MLDFIVQYVQGNFILLLLEIIVFLLLAMKGKIASADFRPMYITVVSILLCTVLDRAESMITDIPALYVPRLILSVACYWLRPAYCLGLIFVIIREKKKRILASIPEIVNIVVMGLAFVPVVGRYVFYFDDNFCFRRGPLGYTVFIVGFIYVLILLYLVIYRLREKGAKETVLLLICAVSIVFSSIAETGSFLRNVTSTLVVISCLVYYLIVYIQMTSVDELTGLYNRETYYTDSEDKHIVAVASIDMNGLKDLNDTQGHAAGDRALAEIAGVIRKHTNLGTKGYRVGGDEFLLLFKHTEEDAVRTACDEISRQVEQQGYSAAVGYAYAEHAAVEELCRTADRQMYENKRQHYGGKRHIRQ